MRKVLMGKMEEKELKSFVLKEYNTAKENIEIALKVYGLMARSMLI